LLRSRLCRDRRITYVDGGFNTVAIGLDYGKLLE
jgi:hypothetical protein